MYMHKYLVACAIYVLHLYPNFMLSYEKYMYNFRGTCCSARPTVYLAVDLPNGFGSSKGSDVYALGLVCQLA